MQFSNVSLSMDQMLSMMGDDEEFSIWDALEDKGVASDYYTTMGDSHNASYMYTMVAARLTESELKDYGHFLKDLVMSCTINGMPCSPQYVTLSYYSFLSNIYYSNFIRHLILRQSVSLLPPIVLL